VRSDQERLLGIRQAIEKILLHKGEERSSFNSSEKKLGRVENTG
jgi:hypothetical protein